MSSRAALALLLVGSLTWAADPPGATTWKFDVIQRKRGAPLRGLILEQGAEAVKIRCISRKPGSPTLLFTEMVPRSEIARVEALGKEERQQLEGRLEALKRERDLLSAGLRALDPGSKVPLRSDDPLDLRPAIWPGSERPEALGYQGAYFRLVANTRPELAQLAAIHLEQIYAAYARALPARTPGGMPTTILLTRSLAEYQILARGRGLNLFNPAFYDPGRNQVVCGSDLERMCDELEKVRLHHLKLRTAMKERRKELTQVYRGKVPGEVLAPMIDAEKRITGTEKRNDQAFARVRQRLFQRLYHESFHAYLGTFVYPAKEGSLPVWFNEGLAQIFETAIVEVGELRVGHADPERLTNVRRALARGTLLPLADLLRSGARNFQVAHAGDQQVSDRHYLAAWGLAFYLTFEQRLVGTRSLDDYVHALKRGTDPLDAFRDLVGKPLASFEKDYLHYLARLKTDGTTGKR